MVIRSVLFCCAVCSVSLFTMPVEAGTPPFHSQDRAYQTYALGGMHQFTSSGYSYAGIDLTEEYDVKGAYESSSVSVFEGTFEYLPGGGFREMNRQLSCPVDRDSIMLTTLWMEFSASLDTTSPGCFGFGMSCAYDPGTGYTCEPYGYDGVVRVTGYWDYASFRSTDTIHRRSRDLSGSEWVSLCKASLGEGMRVGGFSINDLYVPFTGYGGASWSQVMIHTCNDNAINR